MPSVVNANPYKLAVANTTEDYVDFRDVLGGAGVLSVVAKCVSGSSKLNSGDAINDTTSPTLDTTNSTVVFSVYVQDTRVYYKGVSAPAELWFSW